MKGRGVILIALLMFSMISVYAASCDLEVSLVNQDPLLAIPGESVKLVFQIDGIENPECKTVEFELLENYPITLESGQVAKYSIQSGTYTQNYQSFFMAPYTVIVDKDAIDGDSLIEVKYRYGGNQEYITKQFNIEIEDVRADFEVYVEDYDSTTNTLTFEILNTAESDVEALTIEIPEQENVQIRGSNINIVGDLDSNEYTTADFKAVPKDGNITLLISYSDQINERRTTEKTVIYNGKYFSYTDSASKGGAGGWVILIITIAVVVYLVYKRKKKKKALKDKLKKK